MIANYFLQNAVLNEGLRLLHHLLSLMPQYLTSVRFSYGVSSRLQRSHPTEVMKFHEWEIPAGVRLSLLISRVY
jgi:hypothetical protein